MESCLTQCNWKKKLPPYMSHRKVQVFESNKSLTPFCIIQKWSINQTLFLQAKYCFITVLFHFTTQLQGEGHVLPYTGTKHTRYRILRVSLCRVAFSLYHHGYLFFMVDKCHSISIVIRTIRTVINFSILWWLVSYKYYMKDR